MEPTLRDALWLIGFPGLISILSMVIARIWLTSWDREGFASSIALVGAFVVAFIHEYKFPAFPPAPAQGRLLYLSIGIVVIVIAQSMIRSRMFSIFSSVLVLIFAPYVIIGNITFIERRELWMWIIGSTLFVATTWALLSVLDDRMKGGSIPMLLGLIFFISAMTIINAHIATLGKVTIALAVPMFVIGFFSWWTGHSMLKRGGMLATVVLMYGVLSIGYFFSDGMSLRDYVLLLITPMTMWIGEIFNRGKTDSWKRVFTRVGVVVLMLALPGYSAVTGLISTMNEQAESYMY